MPDKEFYDRFKGPVMYPDEKTAAWENPPWNGKIAMKR